MDATNLHITEYRGNQEIDFFGITSFKVQNHGESVVEINTIPIYPGKTVKIIEEDGTMCDFLLTAKFTEEGKIPKFRAIYKQFGNADCYDHLHGELEYAVTLYNYELGDIVQFSQNIAGSTILTRSFDGGLTFLPENDINLGFVEANQIIKYDLGGSLDTTAIQFRNDDLGADSEIFMVNVIETVPPFAAFVTYDEFGIGPVSFHFNKSTDVTFQFKTSKPDVEWSQISIDFREKNVEYPMIDPGQPSVGVFYSLGRFVDEITGEISEEFNIIANIK